MTAKTRKAQAKPWTKKLDQDLVQEALEEACIDAFGEDEQHTGLLTMIGNELQFPFEARVMGQTIQVNNTSRNKCANSGSKLIYRRGKYEKALPKDNMSVNSVRNSLKFDSSRINFVS